MSALIEGKPNGVFQDNFGFYLRFQPKDHPHMEINIPITQEWFQKIDLQKPIKLMVSILV
jgi:hypothetical protein